ncbi:MAG: TIR domain-containing protein [Nitrospirae bacterium]|nr:TIR domain-containing protein [Nitrospirota bacterium]
MTLLFDVFLCHNDKDKPIVKTIERLLQDKGINSFLDKWHLLPGRSSLEKIESAFNSSKCCAVFIGSHGIGRYQRAEIDIALNRQINEDNFPVIPVLLPGASSSSLSRFLRRNTWVDFRDGLDNSETLHLLLAAIGGDEQVLGNFSKSIQEINQLAISSLQKPDLITINITFDNIKKALFKASDSLLNWPSTLSDGRWLERDELNQIREKIRSELNSITLLLGPPGSGKSALLSRLAHEFVVNNIALMAIKADLLPADIGTSEQLMKTFHLPAASRYCIEGLSKLEPVVLIVDQLDALADMVDLHSGRLNVLLDLIHDLSGLPNVHIVASCRSFEHQHDPRLRNIEADNILLESPSIDRVSALIQEKGIQTAGWSADFLELLRIPQYLKIFIDICQGSSTTEIFHSYYAMLEKLWEEKVLKAGKDYVDLLDSMATTMGEREELWLPSAMYQDYLPHIKYLEAQEILTIESDRQRVGFRHQTLFEYARSRAFVRVEGSLSNYVLKRQNGLFVRPQLWNALNYLRVVDQSSYRKEFGALWNHDDLKFHLKILLIEFLGQIPDPQDFEANWLLPYLIQPQYRRRILSCMTESHGWFHRLMDTHIPMFMSLPPNQAIDVLFILKSALNYDREKILEMIERYWLINPEKDYLSLRVLDDMKDWDEKALSMACRMIGRTDVDDYYIDSLSTLISANAPELAPQLVRAYFDHSLEKAKEEASKELPHLPVDETDEQKILYQIKHDNLQPYKQLLESREGLYNLPAVAEAAPKAFLESVWLWFTKVLSFIAYEPHHIRIGYRDDHCLATNLEGDLDSVREYPIVYSVESAVKNLAEKDADNFWAFYEKLKVEDFLVVQRLLARGLRKIVASYPAKVYEFLMEDERRLILGSYQDCHSDTIDLIKLVVPKLDKKRTQELEIAISQFNMYKDSWHEESPNIRLDRIRYNREHRLRLLRAFPSEYMSKRTKRLLEEEKRAFPHLSDKDVCFSGMHSVDSQMSAQQMAKAQDEELLKLFNELTDATGWDHPRFREKGGTIQASRVLGELAKEQPERVVGLIFRMQPKRNEITVGHALEGLSKSELPFQTLFELIQKLNNAGFEGEDFRHYAARAVGERLDSDHELPVDLFQLFESWLKSVTVEKQEDTNEKENKKANDVASVLWQSHRMIVVPHGNYPILDTLTKAYLWKDSPDIDGWLSLLEKHVQRKENPEVWKTLTHYLPNLNLGDKIRSEKFLDSLFSKFPDVMKSDDGVTLIARVQSWVDDSLVSNWLFSLRDSDWKQGAQAFAEILLLRHAWFSEIDWVKREVISIQKGRSAEFQKMKNMRIGLAFSASELWSEPQYRIMATEILLELISDSNEAVQKATSKVFASAKSFFPDEYTWKILDKVCEYPKILTNERSCYLIEHLEDLLTTDPDRIYRVCNAFVTQLGKELSNISHRFTICTENLINIALTLQRLDGYREKGLDLFERLLELDVWNARQTLLEIDRRINQTPPPRPKRRRRKR